MHYLKFRLVCPFPKQNNIFIFIPFLTSSSLKTTLPRPRARAKGSTILRTLDPSSQISKERTLEPSCQISRKICSKVLRSKSSSCVSEKFLSVEPCSLGPMEQPSLPPMLSSPIVAKQVSYHWRTVQRVTLKSQQGSNLAKSQSCREFGTQTDKLLERQKQQQQQRHGEVRTLYRKSLTDSMNSLSAVGQSFRNSFRLKTLLPPPTPKSVPAEQRFSRPGSIMEQAEALKPKSAIKVQVIQEITRRASLGSAISTITRAFSPEESTNESQTSKSPKMSTSVSLPARRNFLNPVEVDKPANLNLVKSNSLEVNPSSSRRQDMGQIVAKVLIKKQLRRSNTQIEMSQHSKVSSILSRRFKFAINNPSDSGTNKFKHCFVCLSFLNFC